MGEQRSFLSGRRYPLSLANCSRQIGRNRVKETTTKTSLWIADELRHLARIMGVPGKSIAQPSAQLSLVVRRLSYHDKMLYYATNFGFAFLKDLRMSP
jgi:hypothetical protein